MVLHATAVLHSWRSLVCWGQVSSLRQQQPVPIMALTVPTITDTASGPHCHEGSAAQATATRRVGEDIVVGLHMQRPQRACVPQCLACCGRVPDHAPGRPHIQSNTFHRPNLHFAVVHSSKVREAL